MRRNRWKAVRTGQRAAFVLALLALAGIAHAAGNVPAAPPAAVLAALRKHRDSRWAWPSRDVLAKYAGLAVPKDFRGSSGALADSMLQPRVAPPAGQKWTYVRLRRDQVEGLWHNYLCGAWQSGGARVYARVFAWIDFVLIQPAAIPERKVVEEIIAKGAAAEKEHPGNCDVLPLGKAQAAALHSLWGRYLRVPMPPLPKAASNTIVASAYRFLSLDVVDLRFGGMHGTWSVTFLTDGKTVALELSPDWYSYDRLVKSKWGAPPTRAKVSPLNPADVGLINGHRWINPGKSPGAGLTNSPGPVANCLVSVWVKKVWRFSSVYADPELHEPNPANEGYSVRADNRKIPLSAWRACEFSTLAQTALRQAVTCSWPDNLDEQLSSPLTRPAALVGMRALRRDYGQVVDWYAKIKVPKDAAHVHGEVVEFLQQGAEAWKAYADWWKALLAGNPTWAQMDSRRAALREAGKKEPSARELSQSARGIEEDLAKYAAAHGAKPFEGHGG